VVGVTSYTFNFSVAKKIIEEIKRIEPKTVTVLGGVHASALPEEILEDTPALDVIVVGEGELTFLELCRKILDGETVEDIRGLALRKNGKVVVNPPRELIENLDDLPLPNREMLPFEKYPVASVQTSRGCPYNCIFCNINRFYGRRIRLRDPRKVAEECSLLIEKHKRDKIYFFGDAFTFKPDWVEELCDEILRRRLKFVWGCETRVDSVSLPLLRKMKRAGCSEVQYGIEYGDEKILKNLGKGFSLGEASDAVAWAKKAELFVGAFFIFNVPGEDEGTMENTFNLIQSVPVDAVEVNLLTPYPGTLLWDSPGSFGMRVIDHDFDYYTTKKYVMENLSFPRDKFIPAFKILLRRLNLVPTSEYYPEIYDFLERDIKLRAWKDERLGIRRLLGV
jgi:anaerobic magnesium-protoporphyrin IX monomethyl ester cyclase